MKRHFKAVGFLLLVVVTMTIFMGIGVSAASSPPIGQMKFADYRDSTHKTTTLNESYPNTRKIIIYGVPTCMNTNRTIKAMQKLYDNGLDKSFVCMSVREEGGISSYDLLYEGGVKDVILSYSSRELEYWGVGGYIVDLYKQFDPNYPTSGRVVPRIVLLNEKDEPVAVSPYGVGMGTIDLMAFIRKGFPDIAYEGSPVEKAIIQNNKDYFLGQPTTPEALYQFTTAKAITAENSDPGTFDPAITALVQKIFSESGAKGRSATTQTQKAEAIHRWVAENIYYDFDAVDHGGPRPSENPLDVLKTEIAVCEGYANLMVELCRAAGLPAKFVLGYGLDTGDWLNSHITSTNSNHAWVEVFVDGKWIICDPTWSSDNAYEYGVKKKGDYYYPIWFNMDLDVFSGSHKINENPPGYALKTVREFYDKNSGYTAIYKGGGMKIRTAPKNTANTTVPSSIFGVPVTTIGPLTFSSNSTWTSITLPASVKTVDIKNFSWCTALQKLVIESKDITFGNNCFNTNSNLKEIQGTNNITALGDLNFIGPHALPYLEFSDKLKEIGKSSFTGIKQLRGPKNSTIATYAATNGLQFVDNEPKSVTIMDGTKVLVKKKFALYEDMLPSIPTPDNTFEVEALYRDAALTNYYPGFDAREDITLYVKFKKVQVIIRYKQVKYRNNAVSMYNEVINKGEPIQKIPAANETAWYTDINLTQKYDSTKPVLNEMTLYFGKKTENTVNIYLPDETLFATAAAKDFDTFTTQVTNPDYTAPSGYYLDKACTKPWTAGMILFPETSSRTAYELYLNAKVSIRFDSDGGTKYETIITDPGKATTLPVPTKTGYRFEGWYNGDAKCSSPFTAKINTALTAKWTQLFTLTFHSDGGSAITPMTVGKGELAKLPIPTKSGYLFAGWYKGTEKYTDSITVTANTLLTAKWVSVSEGAIVKFDAAGGSPIAEIIAIKNQPIQLPIPTKTGYYFDGWYNGGVRYTDSTKITGNVTLTAKWVANGDVLTIKFDSAGGNKLADIQVVKGRTAKLPVPTKEGYQFIKWSDASGTVTDETIITQNRTLVASWAKLYTVSYDSAGGQAYDSVIAASGSKITLPTPTREGYRFDGWYYGSIKYSGQITVTKNLPLVAQWTQMFTVTFDSQGGSAVASKSVATGKTTTLPTPTKANYIFKGWFKGTTEYTSSTPITGNVTLTAKWLPIKVSVSFNSAGGNYIAPILVNKGESTQLPIPVRSGYVFDGWYFNATLYTDDSIFDYNTQLTAMWTTASQTVTVRFDSDGGNAISSVVVVKGQTTNLPTPVKSGYRFDGWYNGSIKYTSSTKITQNVTLTAKWVPIKVSVTFNSAGGNYIAPITVNMGESTQLPTPVRNGYVFAGWYLDATLYTNDSIFDEDIQLTAKWTAVTQTVTVRFDSDGGNVIAPVEVGRGQTVDLPTPVKSGYRFDGWYYGNIEYTSSTNITQDVTLTAKWTQLVTVKFDSVGGSAVKAMTVVKNGTLKLPTSTRSGYRFDGWYLGSTKYTDSTKITKSLTLTAKWTQVYTVKFNSAGGSSVKAMTVAKNGTLKLPTPTRSGYRFEGWYYGSTKYSSSTKITKSLTLTAKWTQVYTVKFDSAGGNTVKAMTVTKNGTLKLPTPTRSGYRFDGWYYGSTKYSNSTKITKSLTLKAKWTAQTYTVKFNSAGGSSVKSVTVMKDKTLKLPTPTRSGYRFDGWYSGSTKYSNSTKITKSVTLTAKWTQVYTVKFNSAGGSTVKAMTVAKNGTLKLPTPTRSGYRFDGWYYGSAKYSSSTKFTKSLTLTAKWTQVYTVKFNSAGGSAVKSVTATKNGTLKLSTPTRTGYKFLGWYSGSTKYTNSTKITKSLTLTAKWQAITLTGSLAPQHASWTRLSISAGGKNNNVGAILWSPTGNSSQSFKLIPQANGYYKIQADCSGKYLTYRGLGKQVTQYSSKGSSDKTQLWDLKLVGTNTYVIYSVASGNKQALDVNGQGTGNGTNVITWNYSGAKNQKWVLGK